MVNNLNITKKGQLIIDSEYSKYLINNFTQTNTLTDWTLGGVTLTNGIAVLTGTAPNITSISFTVNPNDIICFEFTISMPTTSTKTSGGGLYLGTTYGQSVYVHTFNMTSKTWTQSTSTNTNPYFLISYNISDLMIQRHYILGSNVILSDVPWGDTTNTTYPARAIQLPSGTTTTNIRSGYNSGNSSMVINFSNPKIYNITQKSFYETNNAITSFGKNWVNSNNFYEY